MPGRLLRAWILTAILDGLFSSALNVFAYGSSVSRLWQGVASTVFGAAALEQDSMAWAGLAMHFGVAFAWSAVFLVLAGGVSGVRRLLTSPYGALKAAAIFGPCIWLAMSLAVIPALTGRPASITFRWWVQFFGHIPFVAVPIALVARQSVND